MNKDERNYRMAWHVRHGLTYAEAARRFGLSPSWARSICLRLERREKWRARRGTSFLPIEPLWFALRVIVEPIAAAAAKRARRFERDAIVAALDDYWDREETRAANGAVV